MSIPTFQVTSCVPRDAIVWPGWHRYVENRRLRSRVIARIFRKLMELPAAGPAYTPGSGSAHN
jgi:hypothetical protein